MAFELPPLPYDYGALEPVISEETMRLHHDKHHKAYIDKLNKAIEQDPSLADVSIEGILGSVSTLPVVIRDNGGGYWNHDFFWKIMAPGGGRPEGALAAAIDAYGGLEKLQADFNTAGADQFGSGWAWLLTDSAGKLAVTATPDQDNPLMDDAPQKGVPILANDVWEHAYYLTYKNDRLGYLKSWWAVVNWREAGRRYEAAATRMDRHD